MKYNKKKRVVLLFGLSMLSSSVASAAPRSKGVDDVATTSTNQSVNVQVLANDSGRNLKITSVDSQTPNGGLVRISEDQSFIVYTPATNFTGADVFNYTFADRRGNLNSAKVTITVEGESSFDTASDNTSSPSGNGDSTNTDSTDSSSTNNTDSTGTGYTGWPVATADTITTAINTAVSISVLSNDLGQSLQITEANAYTQFGGTASVSGSNISYQPPANFTGEDSFWYAIVDPEGRSNSAKVTVNVTQSQSSANNSNDDASGLLYFDLIPMQNELMYGTNFQYSSSGQPESGGFTYFNIDSAAAGSTKLRYLGGSQGNSVDILIPNQLITYIGTDGEYYTSSVSAIQGDTIQLNQPLKANVARGLNLQNYYSDASHPHVGGETALTDFALRRLNDPSLNSGKHVLLGDSWFASDSIADRLAERLPGAWVVNKGIGGNKSSDMLARFEADVAAQSPDVVWLIAGTNDYFDEISTEEYVSNMSKLIEKVIALGARPIVFDSSLAPLMYGSDYLLQLSKSYASGLASIQASR